MLLPQSSIYPLSFSTLQSLVPPPPTTSTIFNHLLFTLRQESSAMPCQSRDPRSLPPLPLLQSPSSVACSAYSFPGLPSSSPSPPGHPRQLRSRLVPPPSPSLAKRPPRQRARPPSVDSVSEEEETLEIGPLRTRPHKDHRLSTDRPERTRSTRPSTCHRPFTTPQPMSIYLPTFS